VRFAFASVANTRPTPAVSTRCRTSPVLRQLEDCQPIAQLGRGTHNHACRIHANTRLTARDPAFPNGPVKPAVRFLVRAKGLEAPQAFAYQDLDLGLLIPTSPGLSHGVRVHGWIPAVSRTVRPSLSRSVSAGWVAIG
jgi:hypothetical protein